MITFMLSYSHIIKSLLSSSQKITHDVYDNEIIQSDDYTQC